MSRVPRTPHIVFLDATVGILASYLPVRPIRRRSCRGAGPRAGQPVTGRNVNAVAALALGPPRTSRGASWAIERVPASSGPFRLVRRDVHTGVLRARRERPRCATPARRATRPRRRFAGRRGFVFATPVTRATRRARAHAAAARVPARRSRRDVSATPVRRGRHRPPRRRAVGSFSFRSPPGPAIAARAVAARAVRLGGASGRRRFGGSGTSQRDRVRIPRHDGRAPNPRRDASARGVAVRRRHDRKDGILFGAASDASAARTVSAQTLATPRRRVAPTCNPRSRRRSRRDARDTLVFQSSCSSPRGRSASSARGRRSGRSRRAAEDAAVGRGARSPSSRVSCSTRRRRRRRGRAARARCPLRMTSTPRSGTRRRVRRSPCARRESRRRRRVAPSAENSRDDRRLAARSRTKPGSRRPARRRRVFHVDRRRPIRGAGEQRSRRVTRRRRRQQGFGARRVRRAEKRPSSRTASA